MLRSDVTRVMQIEREIFPFPWTEGNFIDSLRSGYDAWLFEDDREIVGYAVVMWLPDEVHLLNLSVVSSLQGRGFGRAALDWLSECTARRGARTMLLEVRPSNVRALRLYESAGFERIGLRRNYYPSYGNSREDALVLQRRLGDG
ncbi:MAG: ribosomal protein S18-alanine N-acetyltransferase [Burkholderiaceae bacterium]|nr:ribosomal protein S18-alanine N-acetyltransferase [Burkholderiaceae bacterium]